MYQKMNPDDPETFFKMYSVFEEQAENLRQTLIKDVDTETVDTFKYFEEINKKQLELTESQEELHQHVLDIEKQWKGAQSNSDSHKQYQSTVQFFQDNEAQIQKMTQQIQALTADISKIKD